MSHKYGQPQVWQKTPSTPAPHRAQLRVRSQHPLRATHPEPVLSIPEHPIYAPRGPYPKSASTMSTFVAVDGHTHNAPRIHASQPAHRTAQGVSKPVLKSALKHARSDRSVQFVPAGPGPVPATQPPPPQASTVVVLPRHKPKAQQGHSHHAHRGRSRSRDPTSTRHRDSARPSHSRSRDRRPADRSRSREARSAQRHRPENTQVCGVGRWTNTHVPGCDCRMMPAPEMFFNGEHTARRPTATPICFGGMAGLHVPGCECPKAVYAANFPNRPLWHEPPPPPFVMDTLRPTLGPLCMGDRTGLHTAFCTGHPPGLNHLAGSYAMEGMIFGHGRR